MNPAGSGVNQEKSRRLFDMMNPLERCKVNQEKNATAFFDMMGFRDGTRGTFGDIRDLLLEDREREKSPAFRTTRNSKKS
jgi:hypothetical protein